MRHRLERLLVQAKSSGCGIDYGEPRADFRRGAGW